MIPLRDNIPSRHYPIVNILLIWANFVVFAFELSQGPHLPAFFTQYAMVPSRVMSEGLTLATGFSIVFSMFLHGGWMHILGNMWFLYIFGDNVEDRLGHGLYLAFYFLCGIAAFVLHLFFNASSTIPAVGASGAIAGVLAGYMLLFPQARIACLLWLFIYVTVIELPAVTFIGIWIAFQLITSFISIGNSAAAGGVAVWAHVGGFAAGLILVKAFCNKREGCRYPYDVVPGR